jgi:Flp pilus assembly protein TadG
MLKFLLQKFARDRRATIAIITAIFIFPLMFLGVGVPIDLARAIQYRVALQNIADGASLAGSEAQGLGANPYQTCKLTLAYANVAVENHELLSTATPSVTLTSPNGTTTNCTGAANRPVITPADAPDEVSVTISGSQPTTFLSIYKPSIPVAVTSSAIGPQGFITINITPNKNFSGDLSQAYYYLRNTDGSLTNEAGTAVATNSSGLFPSTGGVVSLSAFLGDDKYYPTCNGPTATIPCGTQVSIQVKTGLAQRLGVAYYVVTNGQAPCVAVFPTLNLNNTNALNDFRCLLNNQNFTYSPYGDGTSNIINASTNAMNFFNFYHGVGEIVDDPRTELGKNVASEQLYQFAPNAYGSPVGWVNAFFSTDYPSSVNTDNAATTDTDTGTVVTPIAGDSCFTTYTGTGTTVTNGYTAASQSCLITESTTTVNKALSAILEGMNNQSKTATVQPLTFLPSGQSVAAYWSSWSDPNQLQRIGGQTQPAKTDLACLVYNGGTANATADAPTITNKGAYSAATGTELAARADQQENLVIANSFNGTTSSGVKSYGPNVYQCPVDTVGNPYYPDPTCAELNGSTLQVGWNDMGGILWDNGNYVDLHYSYSCQPPAATDTVNSAIIQ